MKRLITFHHLFLMQISIWCKSRLIIIRYHFLFLCPSIFIYSFSIILLIYLYFDQSYFLPTFFSCPPYPSYLSFLSFLLIFPSYFSFLSFLPIFPSYLSFLSILLIFPSYLSFFLCFFVSFFLSFFVSFFLCFFLSFFLCFFLRSEEHTSELQSRP